MRIGVLKAFHWKVKEQYQRNQLYIISQRGEMRYWVGSRYGFWSPICLKSSVWRGKLDSYRGKSLTGQTDWETDTRTSFHCHYLPFYLGYHARERLGVLSRRHAPGIPSKIFFFVLRTASFSIYFPSFARDGGITCILVRHDFSTCLKLSSRVDEGLFLSTKTSWNLSSSVTFATLFFFPAGMCFYSKHHCIRKVLRITISGNLRPVLPGNEIRLRLLT